MNPETFSPAHFRWSYADGVATITLDRPDRKNPLTFESYAELRDTFRALVYARAVKAVVVTGAGGNFSSGGDVHEIIGPLTEMDMPALLDFTRMTGDLVKAMRACPQPIVAALDGVCVGAGAIMAMASDIRLASGPTFAHGITKTQLNTEWAVSIETAIEMEAQAQAICMATQDFRRAFEAFAAKRQPEFKGD